MSDPGAAASPNAPRWRRVARRLHLREVLGHNVLVVAALWGLAVAQPLLDLFGKNPEFFVANQLSREEVALFGVVIALVVPVVLGLLEVVAYAIARRAGVAVHCVIVFLLGTALGLTVLRQLDLTADVVVFVLGLGAGALVLYLERRVAPVRLGLRYLSLAPLVFLAAFLLFSSTSKLLTEEEARAATGVTIGEPAPIVIVQMDEFPTSSLLLPDGTINAQRFPNFARMAEEGTWYRNATSVSPKTTDSVPAMLTGQMPEEGLLPTSSEHPESIFTLLGDAYEQQATEPVTSVCPSTICVGRQPEERFNYERTRTSFADAAVVYGQSTLPPVLRDHLPAVDRSWGGFITDANVEEAGSNSAALDPESGSGQSGSAPNADPSYKWKALGPQGWAPRYQAGLISAMTDSISPGPKPGLWFVHATFPHIPWLLSPTGYQYVVSDSRFVPGLDSHGVWEENPFLVRQGYQRHVLQVGYMDRLLGNLIERLESQGMWEDALVVVLSDHGVGFSEGQSFRSPRGPTVHEMYNIPLFIKYPGQTEGEVNDENALNIDVLPSIVDALDIDSDWEFDGQSLLGDGPDRDDKPVVWDRGPQHVPVDFDGVLDVVDRNEEFLPYGDDWLGVAAVGPYGDLVGDPVTDLAVSPGSGSWTVDQADRLAAWRPARDGRAPLLLHGRLVAPPGGTPPEEALVVVNGTVAGVAGDFEPDEGAFAFSALIAEETLRRGGNEVSLLVPVGGGDRFQQVALS